jgi:hypothetical protein
MEEPHLTRNIVRHEQASELAARPARCRPCAIYSGQLPGKVWLQTPQSLHFGLERGINIVQLFEG